MSDHVFQTRRSISTADGHLEYTFDLCAGYLLLSDAIPQNLFSRVALQSGVAATVLPRTIASADATFQALALAAGAASSDPDEVKLAALRNADPNDLLDAGLSLPARRPRTEYDIGVDMPADRALVSPQDLNLKASSLFGPVWDGIAVQAEFVERAMSNLPVSWEGRNGAKGIMLGCTVDEVSASITEAERICAQADPMLIGIFTLRGNHVQLPCAQARHAAQAR